MSETLQSSVFGTLQRDEEFPIYSTELTIPNHGNIEVSVVAMPGDEPDWSSFVCAAEKSYPVLLQHEPAIREQAVPRIFAIHRECYEVEWQGTATELTSSLSLQHLNFFSDGSFELWYFGGDPFHHHDIRIGLDAGMRVTEVGLEG